MRPLRFLYRVALRVFGLLPRKARLTIAGWATPAYRLGGSCLVRDEKGRVLLVRHSYRKGWALPGGALGWNEDPPETAVRELREEVGLAVDLVGEPLWYFDRSSRRVEVVFWARAERPDEARIASPEISEVSWFAPGELPELEEAAAEILRLALADRAGNPRAGAGS